MRACQSGWRSARADQEAHTAPHGLALVIEQGAEGEVMAMRKRPSLSNHSLSPRQDWRGQLGSHGHP